MQATRQPQHSGFSQRPSRKIAILFGFLAAVFWGASFVGTKIALQELQPLTLVVLRFGVALTLLTPLVLWVDRQHRPGLRSVPGLLILGLLGLPLHQWLQALGMQWTSASQASWLTASAPAWIAVLGWIFLREGIAWQQVLGLILATLGAFCITLPISAGGAQGYFWLGPVLVLLAALAWAGFTILGKSLLGAGSPLQMTYFGLLCGWLYLLPIFIRRGGWVGLGQVSLETWLALLFLAVVCTAGAYSLYFFALRGAETTLIAALQYWEPVATMILALMVLEESLTWISLLGGGMILMGNVLVERGGVQVKSG